MDACRDNPLRVANRSASRGLGRMEGEGTLVMFATSAGRTATDSGIFQRELARGIRTPGVAADEALKRVARAVNRATEGRQTPAIYGLLLEDFEFVPGAALGPERGEVRTNPNDGQRYVYIPPGSFRMGCSVGGGECFPEESPAHEVSITKGFWLGQTEVTVGAYEGFVKATSHPMPAEPHFKERKLNPGWADKRLPMLMVDWNDSQAYCAAGGRLPSEAEWEYAARGETAGPHYGTLADIAWFGDNSGKKGLDAARIWQGEQREYGNKLFANENHPWAVGLKGPNAFGLLVWGKVLFEAGQAQSARSLKRGTKGIAGRLLVRQAWEPPRVLPLQERSNVP